MSIPDFLASLFPAFVVVELAGAADADEQLLTAEEAEWLAPMAPSRRREFAMGRNAARRALAQLGVAPTTIGRHPVDRDPRWPAGIVGSISHSHGVAVAACARASDVLAVGIDIERAGPLGADIVREVCLDEELDALRGIAPPEPSDWAKLLFSIKEAAYKAWFSRERTPLHFHGMRVSLDPVARSFTASVRHAQWVCEGRFGWGQGTVAVGALLRRS